MRVLVRSFMLTTFECDLAFNLKLFSCFMSSQSPIFNVVYICINDPNIGGGAKFRKLLSILVEKF